MDDDYKIILFLCNWAPHTAYQTLQDGGYQIPNEIKMVRIPCTGRISKALLFRAFEMGADGVALVGCSPGACRYGSGTETAMKNTKDTRDILELLGLGRNRMRFATFLPDESEELKTFLADFCAAVKSMGKSSVAPERHSELGDWKGEPLSAVLARHDAYSCQDCGKCTSACPLALSGKAYSPRSIVSLIGEQTSEASRAFAENKESGNNGSSDKLRQDVWSCLTCGICYERCPSDVNFPEFIRDVRCTLNQNREGEVHQAHGGFFPSLMRAMTSPDLKPDHWFWLPDEIETDPDSKTLFFGGCSPYFDVFFRNHTGINTCGILSDALRLLNFFDRRPRILEDERCCGHDLLWTGDRRHFLKLAELNIEYWSDLGIEEIITACPECYRTLAQDYTESGLKPAFKVTHLYEFLENEIDKGAVAFNELEQRITYQDACRLNRLDSMRAYPRKLLERLAPVQFKEMKESGPSALCCGNNAWTGCDAYSKALQVRRIRQAHETGSNLMVTSCPKCQIHLRCAMEDPFLGNELKMEMADLTSIIARTICWE